MYYSSHGEREGKSLRAIERMRVLVLAGHPHALNLITKKQTILRVARGGDVSPRNGGNMKAFVKSFRKLSSWMNTLGGIVLFLMMMLTVVDVFLRVFGKPLVGTYELVAIAGAIVVGFAIPQTSLDKGHINVDFMMENRSVLTRQIFSVFTKLMGITLFGLLSWNLFLKANHLYKAGDVSLTLQIPYYPAAYGLAFAALIECFVLIIDIITIFDSGEKK